MTEENDTFTVFQCCLTKMCCRCSRPVLLKCKSLDTAQFTQSIAGAIQVVRYDELMVLSNTKSYAFIDTSDYVSREEKHLI